jgi:GGDEF domain-containing protein
MKPRRTGVTGRRLAASAISVRDLTAAAIMVAGIIKMTEIFARTGAIDDLTGLGNRRFGNRLVDRLAVGDALVLLDLDRFKRVNDTLGEARGDQLLQELAAVLRGADAGDGDALVERLICAWRDTQPLATLSAGVVFHINGQCPATTRAFADSALNAAKAAGRDRMVLAASYWRP